MWKPLLYHCLWSLEQVSQMCSHNLKKKTVVFFLLHALHRDLLPQSILDTSGRQNWEEMHAKGKSTVIWINRQ